MEKNSSKPNEDLQTIRDIMERSSKFLSLSGLSGVFAGACALMGAAVAWWLIPVTGSIPSDGFVLAPDTAPISGPVLYLALDAILVLVFAFWGAVYFSQRKARKAGLKFWTLATRRLLVHLLIPLTTGGIFILILVFRNHLELAAPVMLIFYGLSLVNAGKFTFTEIHYLGLTEIALGLLAGIFVQQSLLFWAMGFGLMHLVYGGVMYYRHER